MFGIVTFSNGCVSIALYSKIAPSLRAQLLLEIPLLTSRKALRLVTEASKTMELHTKTTCLRLRFE
jgi:hypothetical protein